MVLIPFQYVDPTHTSTLSVNSLSKLISGQLFEIIVHGLPLIPIVSSYALNAPIQSSYITKGKFSFSL